MNVVTVSQLNRYLKSKFSEDSNLNGIFVKGEISGCKKHFASGHTYFTLKDATASIKAVLFKGNGSKIKFDLTDGLDVIALGDLCVYERDGSYQLYVFDIIPKGVGGESVRVEQLKHKLSNKGYFLDEHKKTIPPYPSNIGVITSSSGAVFHDITNILSRRYPFATIFLQSVSVQGDGSDLQIAQALQKLDASDSCDVIILARGGGSLEDLHCFNSELVADAIFSCITPIITGIGHETDFTIADLVADKRASTPSEAAELVACGFDDICKKLHFYKNTLTPKLTTKLTTYQRKLDILKAKLDSSSVHNMLYNNELRLNSAKKLIGFAANNKINAYQNRLNLIKPSVDSSCVYDIIKNNELRLNSAGTSLKDAMHNKMLSLESKLDHNCQLLELLNPLSLLNRGYSIVTKDKQIISDSSDLTKDDTVEIKLKNGAVFAKII